MLHGCYGINNLGRLTIGGLDTVELAREYGTPAYIIDEDEIRKNCRIYKSALAETAAHGSLPLFAGKALCFTRLYRVIAEEGLGADVVSAGELYTAIKAGFPLERVYFHGNNKTDADIKMAVDAGICCFVADNTEELDAINSYAGQKGIKQRVMLRLTPGIDSHTHRKITTGNVDSKFGSAITTGQARELVKHALSLNNIDFQGYHCHIGSQIFETGPFLEAADIMCAFAAEIKSTEGWEPPTLNLGGGYGVRYVAEHRGIDYGEAVRALAARVAENCAAKGLTLPRLLIEPGRSIVAAAGITLYTVGSVKEITGYKNYVSVDGGMSDNPRYALYQSPYEAVVANHASAPRDYPCTIAGRLCESGDILAENIKIQRCSRGDTLAVLVTGAYNYSMASNYNRLPRPPIIMVSGGKPYVAVERESFEDIIKNDR